MKLLAIELRIVKSECETMRNSRLIQLERNIAELEQLGKAYTADDFKTDTPKRWALRYGFS